ncbi:MAG: signal peptidase I [Phycisphaerales bacterium]|nr:signal peptidase I [Phycisphaerales bacterium]
MALRSSEAQHLTGSTSEEHAHHDKSSIKETITSIMIAFILAFVFRGFVIEAFLIPTGSMAPTLMGAHMRFTGPSTGYTWPAGPFYYPRDEQGRDNTSASPLDPQGSANQPVIVHDPMTREELSYPGVPLRSGDRIFVLKYLYAMLGPERFDVIVFKNPTNPQENFIKRLIGLPGEEIAIVDGDVFARPASTGMARQSPEDNAWTGPGWKIARKPERIQRAVWQPVFDSRYTPARPMRDGREFPAPWITTTTGWLLNGRASYRYEGAGPTQLAWDSINRPIVDFYPYNEGPRADLRPKYPVSDLRLACEVQPDTPGQTSTILLEARGHEFRAVITAGRPGKVTLEMRPRPAEGAPENSWTTLAQGAPTQALEPGRATSIEFWHADQALTLWIDGKPAARAEYDWLPPQRVEAAIGIPLTRLLAEANPRDPNVFAAPQRYRQPAIKLGFTGGPLTIHRVQLDRDLFYVPGILNETPGPARATHPYSTPTLTTEQFFVCGDNSPASFDARLWQHVDPWVAASIRDGQVGVVPRDLLVGKAFFVYFPSLQRSLGLPVPDFGRMRWIW